MQSVQDGATTTASSVPSTTSKLEKATATRNTELRELLNGHKKLSSTSVANIYYSNIVLGEQLQLWVEGLGKSSIVEALTSARSRCVH